MWVCHFIRTVCIRNFRTTPIYTCKQTFLHHNIPDPIMTVPVVGPVSDEVTCPALFPVPTIDQLIVARPLVPSLVNLSLTSDAVSGGSLAIMGTMVSNPISPLASAVVTRIVAAFRSPIVGLLNAPIGGSGIFKKKKKNNNLYHSLDKFSRQKIDDIFLYIFPMK